MNGASRSTLDLDVVYRRTVDDHRRLIAALAPLAPYPRGAPPGLPFVFDERTLDHGLNFTLRTSAGAIDILGEIAGGDFPSLNSHAFDVPIGRFTVRCLDLPTLIRVKRAAGRPKDFEAIAELVEILKRQGDSA